MRLAAIGRVADVAELDLAPIEVPLVGYKLDGEEVEEVFRFRPVQPAGATNDMIKATGPDGGVPIGLVMTMLDDCLLAEDQQRYQEFIHRVDVMIEQGVLVELYTTLTEVYAARPTPRWSDSDGGGSDPETTSPAAAPSPASASKKRTSPKR